MADVVETDYTTDPPTVTERDFTPQERVVREADAAANAARQAAEEQAAAAREAALDKLAALGLTRDDLTALGL